MGWVRVAALLLLAGGLGCEAHNPALGLAGTSETAVGGTAPEHGLLWNGDCAPILTSLEWYEESDRRHYELELWREGPGLGGHLSMWPAGGEFEIRGWRRSPPTTAKSYTATVDLVPTDGGELQLEGRFFFALRGATSVWIALDGERLTATPLLKGSEGLLHQTTGCL